jgi:TolB-like protein/tetratricopeptide (TPR) repeat protein
LRTRKRKATINLSHFSSQLLTETRRRKVVPVVITYAVVGWLILQIAGQTFGPLGLPEWGIRVLIVATIACFPAVIFIAWLVDFQQQGMMFDLPLWPGDTEIPRKKNKSGQLFAILLCMLVIAGTGALIIYLLKQFPEPSPTPTKTETSEYPVNSIAVMAFKTFDGHTDSDYFSAGLAEEILNFLAAMKEMNVAARISSFEFREKQLNVREISKLLNVKHILEGSVRREGNRIRVTVQLINGVDGYHEWSKSYDRNLDGIFAIQLEIAAAVVNELKISLSVDSESLLQETPAENIDAYIFYLQGHEKRLSSQDADVMMTAKELFNQALKIDQSYAKAYAGICATDLRLYEISNDPDDFSSAEEACYQAKRLSKSLSSEIQVVLGRLYRYRGWYQKAIIELKSAIKISPTSPDAYIELGEVLSAQNNVDEAEAAFLRAVDLKRNYWKAHEALANFYYGIERYSDSATAYEIVTRLTPDVAGNFAAKGAAYHMLKDNQNAMIAYERSLQLKPSRLAYTNVGILYHELNQFDKAINMQQLALEYAPDDHRVLDRLAAVYNLIPGKELETRLAYERAAELALSNLQINDENWSIREALGKYYLYLERFDEAIEFLDIAVEQSQRSPYVLYLKAKVLLKMDNSEAALTLLEEVVKKAETYRQTIAADPDLQVLKGNERFIQLLTAKSFTG